MKFFKYNIPFSILIFILGSISLTQSFGQAKEKELTKEESELKARERVTNLNFSGKKEITGLLATLRTYPNLTGLDLSGSFIQNKDLSLIQNPKLSYLSLANTVINSDAIAFLSKIPQLRSLNMEGTFINDASLPLIAKLSWLDRLDIGRTNVTDTGIKSLQNSKITRLDLTSLKITDESMKVISGMENMRELYLWNTKITSKGVETIQTLKKLKVFALAGSKIDNESLIYINKMPELKSLNISWTNINDEGLKNLAGNKSIEILSLSGTKITKNGITRLSKMTKLKILSIEDLAQDTGYEDVLADIPHLKILYINSATVNLKSANAIVKKIPWAAVYYDGVLKFAEE